MTFSFRPARSFDERHGLFVAMVGPTNSGKSFSALRLARGIAGPRGKIAALDTEGGRLLHLKEHFDFDISLMDPPFRPMRFAEAAEDAEKAGYDALLVDSFTLEWRGIGGVLDWEETELKRIAGDDFKKRERVKQMARIPGRMAHKSMVFSFLQRRIPIIFSIRGEETIKSAEDGGKPERIFKAQCSPSFPFEVTVSFRLAADRKGIVDLSDPKSWKMEESHRAFFRDGDLISEEHGAALAAWARGAAKVGDSPGQPRTSRMTLPEWIATKLPALLAPCRTHDAVAAVQAGRTYQAALAKASDDERATMLQHVTAALERIDASALPIDDDDTFPGDHPSRDAPA